MCLTLVVDIDTKRQIADSVCSQLGKAKTSGLYRYIHSCGVDLHYKEIFCIDRLVVAYGSSTDVSASSDCYSQLI